MALVFEMINSVHKPGTFKIKNQSRYRYGFVYSGGVQRLEELYKRSLLVVYDMVNVFKYTCSPNICMRICEFIFWYLCLTVGLRVSVCMYLHIYVYIRRQTIYVSMVNEARAMKTPFPGNNFCIADSCQ